MFCDFKCIKFDLKLEVSHEAEVEQLLKFGTTEHSDMEDLFETMEEELLRLAPPLLQKRHYDEQEMTLQITDHLWVQLDKVHLLLLSLPYNYRKIAHTVSSGNVPSS